MSLEIIGEWPPPASQPGKPTTRPGIIIPPLNVLVTVPGIHAWQRAAYEEHENEKRAEAGRPPLTSEEMDYACQNSVDLFFDNGMILIRPDPGNMKLAFEADELLQTLASKPNIRFLQATNAKVREAIKERGECWRISPLPKSLDEIKQMIANSRTSIREKPIYYYNRLTGTRYLTCDVFQQLGKLPVEELAAQLDEIREYSQKRNRLQQPEVALFGTDEFAADVFTAYDFREMSPTDVKMAYDDLKCQFTAATPADMRRDDPENQQWRNAMMAALLGDPSEKMAEEILQGLSPEYFMQLEWLPGCRIENGEIICDSIFEEQEKCDSAADLCDPCAKNFVFDFALEYGDLEYVNIARLSHSLSRRQTKFDGRRRVYLAEIKPVSRPEPVVCILRMQKWDIAGHLDTGKDLLTSVLEAGKYTDYVLDRRLACRQLGMNLDQRIKMHRLAETYSGSNKRYEGQLIWSTYFEREYFAGVATDKIVPGKLESEVYALALARLLGEAAAPNIIIGRLDSNGQVLFDDGDEIVMEKAGVPVEIIVADPTGAFADYQNPFEKYAKEYALPVNSRWLWLRDPRAFADAYLEAFETTFRRIQKEYQRRRKGFDTLFHHRPRDPSSNLESRWIRVLERLDRADAGKLIASIRAQMTDLQTQPAAKVAAVG